MAFPWSYISTLAIASPVPASALATTVIVSVVLLVRPEINSETLKLGATTSTAVSAALAELPARSVATAEKSCAPSARFDAVKVHSPFAKVAAPRAMAPS